MTKEEYIPRSFMEREIAGMVYGLSYNSLEWMYKIIKRLFVKEE